MTRDIAEELIRSGLGIAPSFLFGEETNGLRINFSRLTEERLPFFQAEMAKLAKRLSV